MFIKSKKNLCFLIILLYLSLSILVAFNLYKKPIYIDKTYIGLSKDNLSENFESEIPIQITANYERAFTISNFKFLNKLSGSIIINDIEYELFGMDINGENNLNYLGASAYDIHGNTTHFIFLLDNFESLIISELSNGELTKTFCAPAQNIDEFNMLLNKLN